MRLVQLPFELQVLILDHIKRDNHLDLAPIAQTCKHFSSLVADRFNWTQTVTILQSTDTPRLSTQYLYSALQKNASSNLITNKLQAVVDSEPSISITLDILKRQQRRHPLQTIDIMLPNKCHHELYRILGENPQTNLQELAIRDPTDDGHIMSLTSNITQQYPTLLLLLQQFVSGTLSKSRCTLTRLNLPSFPSYLLLASEISTFPQINYLHIALVGHNQHFFGHSWKQFKDKFPALTELRLTIDKAHLSLFKSLLDDISLFPWIKRLTIQSSECPKSFLSREELRNSLLQLNGLNRITAGWDMIALN